MVLQKYRQSVNASWILLSCLLMMMFLSITGCIKPDEFPPEPLIRSVNVDKTEIDQGIDVFTFTIEFQDGDGDLGSEDINAPSNILFTDLRNPDFEGGNFKITEEIPQRGVSGAISGEIIVEYNGTCCIQGQNQCCIPGFCDNTIITDTVVFAIQLLDRAGNFSNVVESPPIVVRCQ